MSPTHDWHVNEGMELVIRRDEEDSVGVHLGHENIDDAHATTVVTSRLLEMIDTVQPGAIQDYIESQSPPATKGARAMTDTAESIAREHHVRMLLSTDSRDPGIECACGVEDLTWQVHAAHIAAATEQVVREQAAEDAVQRLARAAFQVDSRHHFYEGQDGRPTCSCGFVGDARKRTQTEHITAAVLEAYDYD